MDLRDLEGLSRDQLIARAERAGVSRAAVLTRAELIDEIVRRSVADPVERKRARGLLGLARDLLASVVERGLHLPEAATLIRGSAPQAPSWPKPKPPLATVTLAEIYAAQGHKTKALGVLDEVLGVEPDHAVARALRDRIAQGPEIVPVVAPEPEEERVEVSSPVVAASPPAVEPVLPKPMLDDQPLPEHYDVDEVVAMPVDPQTVYVYWEIRPETFAAARSRAGEGVLVVRIVAVTASWEGPVVHTRDVEVFGPMGDWFVYDLPPGAILRAAVGWKANAAFDPLAVAIELGAPPKSPSLVGAAMLVRFTKQQGAVALEPHDAEVASLARAVETYRRTIAQRRAALGIAAIEPGAVVGAGAGSDAEAELERALLAEAGVTLVPIGSSQVAAIGSSPMGSSPVG